ncbi:uncharacterized protein [Coffea arabica]|uniref:RNase H type-1 domain-containing protein n=1 Tax=Coffea arabica TaxID=13443 RepID=A0ABM4UEU0_COFAR
MEEFNDAVFNYGLSDAGFEEAQFTWTNGVVWQRLDRTLHNGAWNELFRSSKAFHLSRGRSDRATGEMEEFNDAVFNYGLLDAGFEGLQFTWTNGVVWQRLDRALHNGAWNELFRSSKVFHLLRGCSDHAPLLIRCGDVTAMASFFHFLNVWRNQLEFLAIVWEAWQIPVGATDMRGFFYKLCNTKVRLRQWNRDSFGNISQKIRGAEDILHQRKVEYDVAQDQVAKARLGKVRANHARALAVEYREGMVAPQLDFPIPKLNLLENSEFHTLPSMEELKDVVFSMSPENGQQPRGFTSTSIVLIPKVMGASQWKEYRPISLSNFSSKLISTILANRINRLLSRCSEDCLDALSDLFGRYQASLGQRINVAKSSFIISNKASEDQTRFVISKLQFRQQVMCLPKAVIQKLERICNAFLWDKLGGERGIRWRSWDKCCYAVTEGGLGFRSFANMSRVFACKLWLRLRTRDSIWADFMHSKYIKGEHPMVVKWHLRILHIYCWLSSMAMRDGSWGCWQIDCPQYGVASPTNPVVPRSRRLYGLGDSSSGDFSLKSAWAVALRGLVPVDSILQNRGLSLASCCSCCSAQGESLVHIFLDGPVAVEVWQHFKRRFGILCSSLGVSIEFEFGRNKAKLDEMTFDARGVVCRVESLVVQLGLAKVLRTAYFRGDSDDPWRALATPCRSKVQYVAVAWKRPPLQFVKLNTDASVSRGQGTGGGLLRDHEGKVIFAFHKEFGETDVLTTESLALLHGLQLCSMAFRGRLLVEVDSLSPISLVTSRCSSKWPLCNFVRQIREMLKSLSTSIRHNFKEANSLANMLAGSNLGEDWTATSLANLPGEVRAAVALDCRKFSNVRVQHVRE